MVHPDDFALNVSTHVERANDYKKNLAFKVKKMLSRRVKVILLNLVLGLNHFPEFLLEFKGQIIIIPALDSDETDAQVNRLKEYLAEHKKIRHLIFTGGWKNACLKHTINHTISDVERIRFVDKELEPFDAKLRYKDYIQSITVMIDQEFIF